MTSEEYTAFKVTCRRAGFNSIWSGVEAAEALKTPLYEAFERGEHSGDRRLLSKLITDILYGHEWRWAWMCQCAATFEALGIWPLAWRARFVPTPFDWAKVSPYAKIDFLASAMSHTTSTKMWMRRIEESNSTARFQPSLWYNEQCDASRYFAKVYGPRIEAYDLSTLPPFFPADTCSLLNNYVREPFTLDVP